MGAYGQHECTVCTHSSVNLLLHREMYTAYKGGRMEKNPLDFWYKGEIGFFDFYSE